MANSSIEPELNSLRTKLVAEIESDSKEIEIIKKRIEKNEKLLHAVRGSLGALHPENKSSGYGAKANTIKDAISRITSIRFTQDAVEEQIALVDPAMEINRNRIRAALWKLSSTGTIIKLVRKGTNKQPAEYEKLRTRRQTEADKEHTLRNAAAHDFSEKNGGEKAHQG